MGRFLENTIGLPFNLELYTHELNTIVDAVGFKSFILLFIVYSPPYFLSPFYFFLPSSYRVLFRTPRYVLCGFIGCHSMVLYRSKRRAACVGAAWRAWRAWALYSIRGRRAACVGALRRAWALRGMRGVRGRCAAYVGAVRRAWALRGVRGVRGRRAAYVGAVRRAWAPRGVRGHCVAHIFNSPECPFQRCYYRLVN